MIRLWNIRSKEYAVLFPWEGNWHLIRSDSRGVPQFSGTWVVLRYALKDLEGKGWEVLT